MRMLEHQNGDEVIEVAPPADAPADTLVVDVHRAEVKCPCCGLSFVPGTGVFEQLPVKANGGKRLITRVREIMNERSRLPEGGYNFRFDDVANAMVTAMEHGHFGFIKEYLDREMGKAPTRILGEDEAPVKMYVGIPVEGDEAP